MIACTWDLSDLVNFTKWSFHVSLGSINLIGSWQPALDQLDDKEKHKVDLAPVSLPLPVSYFLPQNSLFISSVPSKRILDRTWSPPHSGSFRSQAALRASQLWARCVIPRSGCTSPSPGRLFEQSPSCSAREFQGKLWGIRLFRKLPEVSVRPRVWQQWQNTRCGCQCWGKLGCGQTFRNFLVTCEWYEDKLPGLQRSPCSAVMFPVIAVNELFSIYNSE